MSYPPVERGQPVIAYRCMLAGGELVTVLVADGEPQVRSDPTPELPHRMCLQRRDGTVVLEDVVETVWCRAPAPPGRVNVIPSSPPMTSRPPDNEGDEELLARRGRMRQGWRDAT